MLGQQNITPSSGEQECWTAPYDDVASAVKTGFILQMKNMGKPVTQDDQQLSTAIDAAVEKVKSYFLHTFQTDLLPYVLRDAATIQKTLSDDLYTMGNLHEECSTQSCESMFGGAVQNAPRCGIGASALASNIEAGLSALDASSEPTAQPFSMHKPMDSAGGQQHLWPSWQGKVMGVDSIPAGSSENMAVLNRMYGSADSASSLCKVPLSGSKVNSIPENWPHIPLRGGPFYQPLPRANLHRQHYPASGRSTSASALSSNSNRDVLYANIQQQQQEINHLSVHSHPQPLRMDTVEMAMLSDNLEGGCVGRHYAPVTNVTKQLPHEICCSNTQGLSGPKSSPLPYVRDTQDCSSVASIMSDFFLSEQLLSGSRDTLRNQPFDMDALLMEELAVKEATSQQQHMLPQRFHGLPTAVQWKIVDLTRPGAVLMISDFDEKVTSKMTLMVESYGQGECLAMLDKLTGRLKTKMSAMKNGPGYLDVAVSSHLDVLMAHRYNPQSSSNVKEIALHTLSTALFKELNKVVESNAWLCWELLDESIIHQLKKLPFAIAIDRLHEVGNRSFRNVDNIAGCIKSILSCRNQSAVAKNSRTPPPMK